ncbi:MAG: hypothetical protein ACE5EV_08710, partial [Gaiellales bacterium]
MRCEEMRRLTLIAVVVWVGLAGGAVAASGSSSTTKPRAKVASRTADVHKNRKVQVPVRCANTGLVCKGRVLLRQSRSGKVLGQRRFLIQTGKTRTVTIRLGRAPFKRLRAHGKLRATAQVTTQQALAKPTRTTRTVMLRAPRSDPPATLGSQENPVPAGTSFRLFDGWTVTVLSVTPNATDQVLRENRFNDPPEPGNQFFIATITATYQGTGSSTLDADFRFRALGPSAVVFSTFDDDCGLIPASLRTSNPEVFPGGTVSG